MRLASALGIVITCTSCGGSDSKTPTGLELPVTPPAAAVCATFTPRARAVTDPTSVPAWLNAFAKVIPGGYAGYDAFHSPPAMMLVDTTKSAAAKESAAAVYFCDGFARHLSYALPADAVPTARYGFTRLYAWDAALAAALGKATGVRSRQFDLAANRILVSVVDAAAETGVRGAKRRHSRRRRRHADRRAVGIRPAFSGNPLNTSAIPASIVVDGAAVPRVPTEAQMRTFKILGLAVALAAVSMTASAQGARPATGAKDSSKVEAKKLQGQPMGQRAMMKGMRAPGMRMGAQGFGGRQFGMRGPRMGMRGRMMARRGGAFGMHAQRRAYAMGRMMGYKAGIEATPAQREFFKARVEQRKTIHEQVLAGKLTREQARTQMQAWVKEHRPK